MAVSLGALTQTTLRNIEINGPTFQRFNEAIELSNVTAPNLGIDSLSASLRALSLRTNITTLKITGSFLVSSSLFWLGPSEEVRTLSWPSLERFTVEMWLFNPDGEWYFKEDPENGWLSDVSTDEEESDEEQSDDGESNDFFYSDETDTEDSSSAPRCFRSVPDSKSMNPLLLAMAYAADCMPAIRKFSLGLIHGWQDLHDPLTHIHSVRSFHVALLVDAQLNKRLEWWLGDWRPSEEVANAWRDFLGPQGTIEYVPIPKSILDEYSHRKRVSV